MNVMAIDAYDWVNRIGDQTRQPRRSVRALRGRHRPRARAPAAQLQRPGRAVLGGRGPGRLRGLPQRLRRRRLAPDLPAGLPPRDVADAVGRRPRELRRRLHLFQYLWEQAGGNGDGTYEPDGQYDGGRRRPADQADLPEPGRRDGRRPGRHRRVQRARPARPTCGRPRPSSRTGRSRSTSTTRAPTSSTSRPSTSATRPSRRGPSTSPTTSSGGTAASTTARRRRAGSPTRRRSRPSRRCRSARPTRRSATRARPSGWTSPHRRSRGSRRTASRPTGTRGTPASPTTCSVSTARSRAARPSTSGPGTSSRTAGTTASSRR